MDVKFLIEAGLAILETVFLCITIYYAIVGLKTKNFGKTGRYFFLYLALNLVRRFAGF